MRKILHIALACCIVCLLSGIISCRKSTGKNSNDSINKIPDTLIVGTLYSPTSYFLYKGDMMGYNYDLVQRFASDKGIAVKFKVFKNISGLISDLDSAKIDLIAYNIPITAEFKGRVLHCGNENVTTQVLVQKKGKEKITDVTELVGKEIYVEKNSKYESRLRNLNNEIGGGIKIHTIDRDTLMLEDLIEMVSNSEIPMTIVDSDIAQLDHTYYSNIDISLEVSFPQRSSWAVAQSSKWLADSIDSWAKTPQITELGKRLFHHYFESNKIYNRTNKSFKFLRKGKISPYDDFFKESAKIIEWDWRLLAAQGYVESRFDPYAVSWAGARGVMQMMPGTARHYGLDANSITDPKSSIHAATLSIRDLNKSLAKYVKDPHERKRFILAAYNSGIAHIYDAIALAKKYGKNPQIWHGNVSEALLMKGNPDYYNDEVCKYGYFRGKQTVTYVKEVEEAYEIFKQQPK